MKCFSEIFCSGELTSSGHHVSAGEESKVKLAGSGSGGTAVRGACLTSYWTEAWEASGRVASPGYMPNFFELNFFIIGSAVLSF